MRYLKGINENSENISKLINWELISDLKEMSLEYLDMGLVLFIHVDGDDRLCYKEIFSHDPTEILKAFYNTRLFHDPNLEYKLSLLSDDEYIFDNSEVGHNEYRN